jgi:hypothetical protein
VDRGKLSVPYTNAQIRSPQFLPYSDHHCEYLERSYTMADEEERIKAEKLAAAKKRVSLENRHADDP